MSLLSSGRQTACSTSETCISLLLALPAANLCSRPLRLTGLADALIREEWRERQTFASCTAAPQVPRLQHTLTLWKHSRGAGACAVGSDGACGAPRLRSSYWIAGANALLPGRMTALACSTRVLGQLLVWSSGNRRARSFLFHRDGRTMWSTRRTHSLSAATGLTNITSCCALQRCSRNRWRAVAGRLLLRSYPTVSSTQPQIWRAVLVTTLRSHGGAFSHACASCRGRRSALTWMRPNGLPGWGACLEHRHSIAAPLAEFYVINLPIVSCSYKHPVLALCTCARRGGGHPGRRLCELKEHFLAAIRPERQVCGIHSAHLRARGAAHQ